MKRSLFIVVIIATVAGGIARPAKAASDGITRYYAVICGVSDYLNPEIGNLDYCDDDAKDIRSALVASNNWSSSNITLLVNSAATKSAIQTAIQNMANKSDEDDVCLFFFSGHGAIGDYDIDPYDELDGYDEYMCPYDSAVYGWYNDIRDDEFSVWIAGLPTNKYIILLDTCESGGQIKGKESAKSKRTAKNLVGVKASGNIAPQKGDGFAADLIPATAIGTKKDLDDNGRGVVITACDDDEGSYEYSELENGVFTYYLLEGMAGYADADSDNHVSAEELYNYTSPLVTNYTYDQHPQLYDAFAGNLDFLIFDMVIDKCTVTAGTKDNTDKISFSGKTNATADDFYSTDTIEISVAADDTNSLLVTFPVTDGVTFKNNKYSYSGTEDGIKKSFKYDVKTRKFSFSASNLNLSGLRCPLTIEIQIGSYNEATEVDETIVNGQKPMPIILLMGIENSLRVDSIQPKRSTTTNKSQLTVKGVFTAADAAVDMATVPFSITLGSQTFTIPADSFKANKGKFTCSKVNVTEGGIAAATFDFNKGTFTLTIKNINIAADLGAANFSMDFGSFSADTTVTLP